MVARTMNVMCETLILGVLVWEEYFMEILDLQPISRDTLDNMFLAHAGGCPRYRTYDKYSYAQAKHEQQTGPFTWNLDKIKCFYFQ